MSFEFFSSESCRWIWFSGVFSEYPGKFMDTVIRFSSYPDFDFIFHVIIKRIRPVDAHVLKTDMDGTANRSFINKISKSECAKLVVESSDVLCHIKEPALDNPMFLSILFCVL
ncbi:MAG: hypothetical protein MR372_04690 [Lachnospiraceae bacterium]|nr:hypothetical protein [Lachnospiraceae bacterium]MDY6221374.1 hypothetical protein [Candidatus Alectryocaccobium sp.]